MKESMQQNMGVIMNRRVTDRIIVTDQDRWDLMWSLVEVLVAKLESGDITTDEYNMAVKKLVIKGIS